MPTEKWIKLVAVAMLSVFRSIAESELPSPVPLSDVGVSAIPQQEGAIEICRKCKGRKLFSGL